MLDIFIKAITLNQHKTVAYPHSHRLLHSTLLVLLTLVGLGLRIWFMSVNQLSPDYAPTDDGDYYRRAFRFATTGQYVDDFWCIRPPLHVLLFALLLRVSMMPGMLDGISLVRVVQITLIVLTIPMGYDLARRLFHRNAGLIFATTLAIWFPLVELPAHFYSEPLFFFLFMSHLWLLVCWRDTRHWYLLAAAGVALGLAALTRSQALNSAAFVIFWLLLLTFHERRKAPAALKQWLLHVGQLSCIFLCAMILTILPWSVRNYLVYQQVYVIDTTGPILIWLRVSENGAQGTTILRSMPQAERQPFAVADIQRIMREDPVRFLDLVWGQSWEHFREVWKAQYIEDFLNQRSFYLRPLREFWVLGVVGDLIWLSFTMTGLMALVAPLREGHFRWVAIGWITATLASVMVWHPEPRYLLPVWLLLALYSSWLISQPRRMLALLRHKSLHGAMAVVLVVSFLVLFISYRDYPSLITRGIRRELHLATGTQAYTAENYAQAAAAFRRALAAQPNFVESRTRLSWALIAQEQYQEARLLLTEGDAQQLDLARGALARAQGNPEQAAAYFIRAENSASADVQSLARVWLPVPQTNTLLPGQGQDLGYITGFSRSEQLSQPDSQVTSYRWLQGRGSITLPLPQPVSQGSVLSLRMTTGRPEGTNMQIHYGDVQQMETIRVAGGEWRTYHLLVPETLVGQQRLELQLIAPTFIPAQRYPGSNDLRPLSIMLSTVAVM